MPFNKTGINLKWPCVAFYHVFVINHLYSKEIRDGLVIITTLGIVMAI